MKRTLIIGFAFLLLGGIVFAANVSNISEKAKGGSVSYQEFNDLVSTIRGLKVNQTGSDVKVGLNADPSNVARLNLGGLISARFSPSAPGNCSSGLAGTIYASSVDKHLYGCDGSNWVVLDTDIPTCNF